MEIVNGKYRLKISTAYSRMYYGKDQKRPNTGLSVLDSKGRIDKADADTISAKVAQMHNDLANVYFDKTLVKYGLAEAPTLSGSRNGKREGQEYWRCTVGELFILKQALADASSSKLTNELTL